MWKNLDFDQGVGTRKLGMTFGGLSCKTPGGGVAQIRPGYVVGRGPDLILSNLSLCYESESFIAVP